MSAKQPIPEMITVTLPSEEIGHLLLRYRRTHTIDRYQPQIDRFLKQVLLLAREFLPSESGAILLDDPRLKLLDARGTELTVVGAFGTQPEGLLRQKQSCTEGLAGQVYGRGRGMAITAKNESALCTTLTQQMGMRVTSVLAVPIVLGNSTCGVLLLVNRLEGHAFSDRDHTLLELFAGYLSSSMQNMLDAMRSTEVARRDDLTGLYNDRYLQFQLREEISTARKTQAPLALLFIDLDNFKNINDQHGHLEGSRTLNEVGLLLQRELASDVTAARYGGDEFVVILPQRRLEEAAWVGHQLRECIAQHTFLRGGDCELSPGTVTASVGVAALPGDPASAGTSRELANGLIRAADQAMYAAKAKGKNTVIMASNKQVVL